MRAVRRLLSTVTGFKSVTVSEHERTWGWANSVITGVTEVLTRVPSVVVMEDDLLTSRNFLAFVNAALSTYERSPRRLLSHGLQLPAAMPRAIYEDAYLSYRGYVLGLGDVARPVEPGRLVGR